MPYADMMEFAKVLSDKFQGLRSQDDSVLTERTMADALAQLGKMEIESADTVKQEEKLLREIFSRKRQLTIELSGNGWRVSIGTLNASVLGTGLREAISTILDQVVVARALTGGASK